MTPAPPSAASRQRFRPKVDLSAALVDRVKALADRNGVTIGELTYWGVITAARAVEQGRGQLLPKRPPSRRAPWGSRGSYAPVRWTQGRGEYTRCRELIERGDVDSSITDVVRAFFESYVAAGGDVVAMRWPSGGSHGGNGTN